MKFILFATKNLRFLFKNKDHTLLIFDRWCLSFSEEFLSAISRSLDKSFRNDGPFLPRFTIKDANLILILNINHSLVSFPVRECSMKGYELDFFTEYNGEIYEYLSSLTDYYMKGGEGEIRIARDITGVIVFYDEREDKKEISEIVAGLLNLYSPEEIVKEFM